MVREHYARLGFRPDGAAPGGITFWRLKLMEFAQPTAFIGIVER
jgi:hypothetical protein